MNDSIHKNHQDNESNMPWYKFVSKGSWVLISLITLTAAYYALTQHQLHLEQALPYIFIGSMLLMHLGHGRHSGHGGHKKKG